MHNKASISAGKFNIKMLTYSKLISLFGLKGSADSSASTFSSSNVSGTSIKKHVCRIIEIFTRLQGFHRFVKKKADKNLLIFKNLSIKFIDIVV